MLNRGRPKSFITHLVLLSIVGVVSLLVLAPPFGVILLAINESKESIHGAIFDTVKTLVSDPEGSGILNSIMLGAIVAVVSTGIAFVSALSWWHESRRQFILGSYFIIATFPPALYCVGWTQIWGALGQHESSEILLIIAQCAWAVPFSTAIIMVGMSQIDIDVIRASYELSGGRAIVSAILLLRLIIPAVLSAFLVNLLLSLNDYVRASYLSGPTQLLSKYIYGKMASGADVTTYWIGGITVLAAFGLTCFLSASLWLTKKSSGEGGVD